MAAKKTHTNTKFSERENQKDDAVTYRMGMKRKTDTKTHRRIEGEECGVYRFWLTCIRNSRHRIEMVR